jgi:uncharacterized protein YjeT (DUF2065 family)
METFGIPTNVPLYCILGIIFLVVGLLYLFAPGLMKKLDEIGKKPLWKDEWTGTYRIVIGIFFIIAGLLICYTGFIVLTK